MTPGPGVGDLVPHVPLHPPKRIGRPTASITSASILSFIPITPSVILTRFRIRLFPGISLSEIVPHPSHGGFLVGDGKQ